MTTVFNHLRLARPTDRLEQLESMYRDGLGFEVLASWRDHEGIDGAVLGHRDLGYQIEFTQEKHNRVGGAPTKDHLLVFYILDSVAWHDACERMRNAGFAVVKSANPYWDRGGRTFEDPDGYRVVLHNAPWPTVKS